MFFFIRWIYFKILNNYCFCFVLLFIYGYYSVIHLTSWLYIYKKLWLCTKNSNIITFHEIQLVVDLQIFCCFSSLFSIFLNYIYIFVDFVYKQNVVVNLWHCNLYIEFLTISEIYLIYLVKSVSNYLVVVCSYFPCIFCTLPDFFLLFC